MKQLDRLTAPLFFKGLMLALAVAIFSSIFKFQLNAFSIPIIIFLVILALSQLEDYYLSDQFIKKRKERILLQDVTEVRKLLWWWIITDEYGDSMWINYSPLEKESKEKLQAWLSSKEQNSYSKSDQGGGINSVPLRSTT